MVTVVIKNWREGLRKVSLSKLQHNLLGIALPEAKQNVDSLLNGEPIVLNTAALDVAQEFVREAEAIGAVCEIIKIGVG